MRNGLVKHQSAERLFCKWWNQLEEPFKADPSKLEWRNVPLDLMRDDGKYRPQVLEMFANGLLYYYSKELPNQEHPRILNPSSFRRRKSREINVRSGTPDPSIEQGIYWRTDPRGKKVNSDEQRHTNRASYYARGSIGDDKELYVGAKET